MCTPVIPDWIYPIGFCAVLSIALVFLIVFQVTFSAVCILLTLGLFVYYYYYLKVDRGGESNPDTRSPGRADSPHGSDPQPHTDDPRASNGSNGDYGGPARGSGPGAPYSSDRYSGEGSSLHKSQSFGPYSSEGLRERTPGTRADCSNQRAWERTSGVSWRTESSRTESLRTDSNSVSDSRSNFVSSSSVSRECFENDEFSRQNPLQSSEERYHRSLSSSSSSVLPKFKRLSRSDVSSRENLPPGEGPDAIHSHPAHQPQYGSLGVLPSVHLPGAHQTKDHNCPSFDSNRVFVKIASPDPLKESPVLYRQEKNASSANSSDTSNSSSRNISAEKRKRNAEEDELEAGTSHPAESPAKRRKTCADGSSKFSGETRMSTHYPNLKRPALSSVRDESVSAKVPRLSHPVSPSSPRSQPGASARNPVEASYTSSKRWMERMATPEVSVGSRASSSPGEGHSLRSEVRINSKTCDIVCNETSRGSPVEKNCRKENSSAQPISRSSPRPARLSSGRNTPVCSSASQKKGVANENFSNNASSSEDLMRTDQTPSSVEVSSYKLQVTAEDVEKDREKELERSKRFLGEESDIVVPEIESRQEAASLVSSSSSSASIQCGLTSSAGDTVSGAVCLSPAATNSSSTTDAQSITVPILSQSTAVEASGNSDTKSSSVTRDDLPESGESLKSAVVLFNQAQASVTSQSTNASQSASEVPLKSAGFDVDSAASSGGFQFEFAAPQNKTPSSLEVNNSGSAVVQYQPNVSPGPSTAIDAKSSNNHTVAIPDPNRTLPIIPPSTTTSVFGSGVVGSQSTSQFGFPLQNDSSKGESAFASVFLNSGASSGNTVSTTSDAKRLVPSGNQSMSAFGSQRPSSVDFLNDIGKTQASKEENASKSEANCFTGALGSFVGGNIPPKSSTDASIFRMATPANLTPGNSFMNTQISSNLFGNPALTSNSTPATNSFSTSLFSSPASSAGFFSSTSTTNSFGSQSVGSATQFASPPRMGFNFGDQANQPSVFGNPASSGFSFPNNNSASPSAMDSRASEPTSPSAPFGAFGNFSQPNSGQPKLFGNPSAAPNSFPSGQPTAFPPNQNIGNASMFNPPTTNQIGFGRPANPFNFGQNSGTGFAAAQTNPTAMAPNQFAPMQNNFGQTSNPLSSFTPRFSIGTDNSSSTKSRSLQKSRLKKRS